jgi:histidine triad (HIT) family protein
MDAILMPTRKGKSMPFLLTMARTYPGRIFLGWIFEHMDFLLPLKRLHETETLLAFRHPQPSYPVHILLVPKKAIGSMADLKEEDSIFLQEVFRVANVLVDETGIRQSGYRLILNGGTYQEVPQIHFHLVGGQDSIEADEADIRIPLNPPTKI